ncbi:MAG: cell envelope biogenesis protein OmpA, partial [Sphingobacteriales bacterium]
YKKAIEAKQQDAETYYRYAQMLKADGQYEEYNKQMKKFASMAPKDQRAVAFNQDPDYLPKLKSQTRLFNEKILDINDEEYGSFGAVLTNDNTFYFTSNRNTARKKYGRDEQPYLDIYSATYNGDGSMSEPTPLSSVNTQHHDGPIAITADGNTMYFASESYREGDSEKGKGQKLSLIYLYKATKKDGKWGTAVALPFNNKAWNTNHPSVSKDGKWLYFSSNRKGTTGGADIWKVEIKGGNSYGEPINLGTKVNTEGREDYPYIDGNDRLFFSSDGRKGFGALDIFFIDEKKGTDAQNVGLPVNSPKDDFAFTFSKEKNIGFFTSNREANKDGVNIDKLYSATPVCGVEAIVFVKDSETGQPIASARVAILDEKNNVIETRTAGADGKVTYNVDCNRAYKIQAMADKYESNTFPIAANKGGTVNVDANLKPIKVIVDVVIHLNEIYFEFNKSNITKEAAFELDKAVEAMKDNPALVVLVKSHTDSRGSDKYNMRLSDRRAKATVQYIISKGIAKERISGQGYGESEPKVNCTTCTEEEHAQNRRSEFIIVKK